MRLRPQIGYVAVEAEKEHAREKVGICVRVRQNKRLLILVVPFFVLPPASNRGGEKKEEVEERERE